MRRIFLTIPLLILVFAVKAGITDSLKTALSHASSDELRVHLLYKLGRSYADDYPDSSQMFYGKCIELGKNLKADTVQMEVYCAQSVLAKDPESSRANLLKALPYAQKLGHKEMESFILVELGQSFADEAQYNIALDYYHRAFQIEQKLNRRGRQAMIYFRIGMVHDWRNDFPAALEALTKSCEIEDSLGRLYNLNSNYSELATIFSKQSKFSEALRYLQKVDSISVVIGDSSMRLLNKMNLGIVYKNMGNVQKAINIYNDILKSRQADSIVLISLYHNLAVALALNKQFREAEQMFLQAEDIANRKFHNSWFLIQNNLELARAKLAEHDYDKALYYTRRCEQIVRETKASQEELKDCMFLLSEIYKARGDMAHAYDYYKKFADLQDSIFHKKEAKNIAEAETRLKLADKNNQVATLSRQNELQRLRSQKESIINIALLSGLIIGGLLVLVIIRAYRKTLKQNAQLTKQKAVIDAQVEQLAQAGTMKSKFFANISHELRTPVTLLTGMLELLQDKVVGAKEKEKLAIAFSNSRKLQKMIEEMLDLSRLESGLPVIRKERTEICHLTKRIVYAFETLMERNQLKLSYIDHIGHDVFVMLDEDKYEKTINNLIYNAIKFSGKAGTITVELMISEADGLVLISVRDTGCGIRADDLPHIFERFYQGTASIKSASPGSGIGLSLVKEFTRLQSGSVSVSSKEGEGSQFTLSFPIIADIGAGSIPTNEDAEEQETSEAVWQKPGGQAKILLVEDNDEMRYYVKDVLSSVGVITEAVNGLEALKCLDQFTPDLIISDVMMPEMDGQAFLTHIKASEIWNKIPVIMLTALATKEDQIRMLAMGVDDYIVKPFNAEELRIRVYNLLNNLAIRRQWSEKPAEPDEIVEPDNGAIEFREKIYSYVSSRLKETALSVNDLASHLTLSERQLYRLSNTLTGCTPAQLIKEVRLKKAYDLLVAGEVYKVDDLARRVGFENSSYFSRQFLSRFGKRPAEFL